MGCLPLLNSEQDGEKKIENHKYIKSCRRLGIAIESPVLHNNK
jgi:hypothetical protein